jgi:hypothetical protein
MEFEVKTTVCPGALLAIFFHSKRWERASTPADSWSKIATCGAVIIVIAIESLRFIPPE